MKLCTKRLSEHAPVGRRLALQVLIVVVVTGIPAAHAFTVTPLDAQVGDVITFRDIEGGKGARSWDFGDGGRGTGTTAQHVYKAAGDYTIRLTVGNRSEMQTVTIRHPAIEAMFDVLPLVPTIGTTVEFVDRSIAHESSLISWSWNFGDGNGTEQELRPRHAFMQPGNYTVRLLVSDEAGNTAMAERWVRVLPSVTVDPRGVITPPTSTFMLLVALAAAAALLRRNAPA